MSVGVGCRRLSVNVSRDPASRHAAGPARLWKRFFARSSGGGRVDDLSGLSFSSKGRNVKSALCPMLWEGFDISRHGVTRPCCSFDGTSGETVLQTPAVEIMRGARWKQWRQGAVRGERLVECRRCYAKEAVGGISDRQIYLRATELDHGKSALSAYETPDSNVGLRRLTLHLGNTCNLKCRMCNANASSGIAADAVHRRWADREIPHDRHGGTKRRLHGWCADLALLGATLGNTPELIAVQLSGGEPLLMHVVNELLDRWIKRGLAANIDLSLATNACRLDDRLLKRLTEFRVVRLACSLDGIGATNDYLRSPSCWSEIESNIKRIRALPHLKVVVAFTLSAANVFEVGSVAGWAASLSLPFRFGIVNTPSYMSLDVLPPTVRRKAADYALKAERSFISTEQITPEIEAIARTLHHKEPEFDPTRLRDFMAFMSDLDSARNESLKISLPRLVHALAEAGFEY